jgi:hypothetical protein
MGAFGDGAVLTGYALPTVYSQLAEIFSPSYPQCCCADGLGAAAQHHV